MYDDHFAFTVCVVHTLDSIYVLAYNVYFLSFLIYSIVSYFDCYTKTTNVKGCLRKGALERQSDTNSKVNQ